MTKQPFIGLTMDSIHFYPSNSPEKKYPTYQLRHQYCEAISRVGGIPVALPYCENNIDSYASALHGLIVTGGGFDVSPHLYGEEIIHESVLPHPLRTNFEWKITEAFLKQNKPVLGICGGMQLINVMFGGTLIQHIPLQAPSLIEHTQQQERSLPQHSIKITPQTRLWKLVEEENSFDVNSIHHQAVKDVARDFVASATAEDGLIEAIESTKHLFCLGVQWHPEFLISENDKKILEGFIRATQF